MILKGKYSFVVYVTILFTWGSCANDSSPDNSDKYNYTSTIPVGFPNVDIPADNEMSIERINLGKKLFFDPILSSDSSISCASCHHPGLAFSDSISFSLGVKQRLGTRNAIPLANVAYQKYLLREGSVPSLEQQVAVPIQEHNEFDFNILQVADRMNRNQSYKEMSYKAYGRYPDPFVITRAIASFERTMLSGNSRYDQYTFQAKKNVLTDSEIRGMNLFKSEKTSCASCHNGFLFTNFSFQNNGLYEEYNDEGRMRFTNDESDRAKFKVPSLRNVSLTAPYMFDGSLANLDDVINHYESGGKSHPNKSKKLKPFTLTNVERADLKAFLHTLVDYDFVNNPELKPK